MYIVHSTWHQEPLCARMRGKRILMKDVAPDEWTTFLLFQLWKVVSRMASLSRWIVHSSVHYSWKSKGFPNWFWNQFVDCLREKSKFPWNEKNLFNHQSSSWNWTVNSWINSTWQRKNSPSPSNGRWSPNLSIFKFFYFLSHAEFTTCRNDTDADW